MACRSAKGDWEADLPIASTESQNESPAIKSTAKHSNGIAGPCNPFASKICRREVCPITVCDSVPADFACNWGMDVTAP